MTSKLKYILLIGFIFRVVLAFGFWHPDLNNHVDWGIRFFEYGPEKFYAPESNVWNYTWPNQPPGTILIFALVRKLFELVFGIFMAINVVIPAFPSVVISFFEKTLYQAMLKLPSILSDIGIGVLIYKFFKDQKKEKLGVLGAAFFIFNPVIWYNSSIWGQTDSIINFLVMGALYFLFKRSISGAVLFLAASLYTKVSLAIFIPLFVIIAIKQKYRVQDYIGAVVFPIILFLTITFVFSGKSDILTWLYELYTKKVLTNQMQVITANAFNLWAFLTGIYEQPHSMFVFGVTYQGWGTILFGLSYIPLLISLWKSQKLNNIVWVFALTAFSSWMLFTNMHERYLYPLFPYLTILAIEYKSLRPIYWLLSGVNVVNLYHLWYTPKVEFIINFLSFGDRLMPRILGLLNTVVFIWLYYFFGKSQSKNGIIRS